jgi:hypothetical protein
MTLVCYLVCFDGWQLHAFVCFLDHTELVDRLLRAEGLFAPTLPTQESINRFAMLTPQLM